MSKSPFVHLHFHTQYSLLDGASRVGEVMSSARDKGMSGVAITDHGVLYGCVDFYKNAKKNGIKPILGCEAYIAHGSMHDRKRSETGSQANHFVLLAQNEEGYSNLCHLISKAHLEGFYYKPRIDKELLAKHSKGLIGLSACLKGDIPEACLAGDLDRATELAGQYADMFGPHNFYLEMQDHGLAEQHKVNDGILQVAKRTGLPLVATNDVHYVKKEHAEAHEVMLCLQTQTVMSDPKRMRYGAYEFYMKSADEMWELFGDHPDALNNTLTIAEQCNVDLRLGQDLHFPTYDVPAGTNQKQYLMKLVAEGLRERYGLEDVGQPKNEEEKRIVKRFHYEMSIIEKTGFINYFLVVWDFIRFAFDNHIPVGPGRGSGAGSIVAYALNITGIDPLQYNLIFERFLNPERVSPPDFDIDFCQSRRGEVIEYVKQKYGRDNVAQIITFGTLGAKTVIRDIGRVLEIPFGDCDRLAKLVPDDPGMTLEKALKQSPDFKRATESEPNAKQIMKYARVLEGLPRNPGTHAAGVVIGEKPLIEIIPLARDKDNEVVTQFGMKPLEEVGLLKMDFLGLRTLTVIQEAVDNVQARWDVALDMATLPMDDEKTFELLNRGDTVGVFQVESKGMRDLLRRIGLTRFEDLIAMIALFRPGPMNMLDDYVNRKHGKVRIDYDHPLLEGILNETYGVMLYQEQVQQAANVLAGFSLGQGDILRRAMGKKIKEEMASQRQKFIDGCAETNKIPKKTAETVFDNIERFAGYGFNKSHSAAYAILSYQTAYLKAHYPTEFMAALLSSEMGNSDKLPLVIAEVHVMGLHVLPPDVNESGVRFTPVDDGIRFGMAGVKNVGAAAVESIVKEREEKGPFKGLVDFCMRLDSQAVNRRLLESLVMCGAFDFTGMSRGRLFNGIEFAMSRAASTLRDKNAGQTSMFDMLEDSHEASSNDDDLPEAAPWPESQMLIHEKELLGFYISGHPLSQFEWALKTFGLADTSTLPDKPANQATRVGGLVTAYTKRFTKKTQEPMAVFQLEDLHGLVEVVAFPNTFREYGTLLQENQPVMVCGELGKDDQLRIRADEIYTIQDACSQFAQRVSIHVPAANLEDDKLLYIKETLQKYPGTTPVVICLQFPTGEKVFVNTDRSYKVSPSEEMIRDLEEELGEEAVYVAADRQACKKGDSSQDKRRTWAAKKRAKDAAVTA